MKNQLRNIFIALALFSVAGVFSQTSGGNCKITSTIINGVYHGKNLNFQNQENNGIQKIFLNNKEVKAKFNSKTFELSLAELKLDQAFELKIVYCEMAPIPYSILNPEVIK